MRIIAATRVLNEDDVIEPFIRHHATMVDHHMLLDNGSIDRTVPILSSLRDEGFPLTVLQTQSVTFEERYANTILYQAASRTHHADWIIYLDADEFLDTRASDGAFRTLLESVPPAIPAIRLNMMNYHDTWRDDPEDWLLPRRIAYRAPALADVWKICIRGGLPGQVIIEPGNHGATVNGLPALCVETPGLRLAHFAHRSAWHEMAKVVVGRLKVLSTGGDAVASNRSSHYTPVFERLMHKPSELLLNPDYLGARDLDIGRLAHDPIRYEGGSLRYTQPADYRMKAVQSLLSYAERLARHHAALLERSPGAVEELSITPLLS
ncbi:MAG: glycosyltransferase family 2 protein [Acidisphaera sp.]|nr:glycosyltransferase family 2 protein [Acidisphaera sp.]